jgi:branched-subunit amino acid ABC-type transport system permease component
VVGGVALGFIESQSAAYWGAEYRQLIDFAALFLVAVARPQGLVGARLDAVADYS